jgi:ubiquinone/menaquinone biosynthesis C-methylase UbiE
MTHEVKLNPYDEDVAAAFKAAREIPREGLTEWREAIRRHLQPSPGMTVLDIGAGTGAYSAAFADWFDVGVVAVEPSAAMRARIPETPAIEVLAGDAMSLPLEDDSADGAWLSLVIHHIPDLEAAAREIRRVLRPGAPVLVRQAFPDRTLDGIEMIRWYPETARLVMTYPTLGATREAFAAAGFRQESVEPVREIRPESLEAFLAQADTLRRADTTVRLLTEDEFQRGKERLRQAVVSGNSEPRSNTLDLLVLR